jgi:hypothetical protein
MHRVIRKKYLRREQLGHICLKQGLRPSPVIEGECPIFR